MAKCIFRGYTEQLSYFYEMVPYRQQNIGRIKQSFLNTIRIIRKYTNINTELGSIRIPRKVVL